MSSLVSVLLKAMMPSLSDAPAMTVGSCSSSSLLTFSGSARLNEQEMRPGPIRRGSSVAWILLCCFSISIYVVAFFLSHPNVQYRKKRLKEKEDEKKRPKKEREKKTHPINSSSSCRKV